MTPFLPARFVVATFTLCVFAAVPVVFAANPHPAHTPHDYINQPDEWFKSPQGRSVADNIVSWQNADGGWWKNYDPNQPRPNPMPPPDMSDPPGDTQDIWRKVSTFDNNTTWSELRVLARAHRVTGDDRYKDAFVKGLHYVLESQYSSGGFPQRYPLQNNYGRWITFNDNAMIGVMDLLKDIADQKPDYTGVTPADDLPRVRVAFDKGVDCILHCQVTLQGKLTVWPQQSDPVTFEPRPARAYELPSLTASESTGIVLFLMSLDHPSPRVRQSVDAAMAWFDANKITGKRFARVTGSQYENGVDKVLVDDPAAPPLWARFYDLDTGKPFFVSRDGKKHTVLTEVPHERRVGYAWYGTWPQKAIDAYPKWAQSVKP